MDFMVVDIGDDGSNDDLGLPLIFRRPFLATAGVVIDVPMGEVILRVDREYATLKMFDKPPPTANLFPPLMSKNHSLKVDTNVNEIGSNANTLWQSFRPP